MAVEHGHAQPIKSLSIDDGLKNYRKIQKRRTTTWQLMKQ